MSLYPLFGFRDADVWILWVVNSLSRYDEPFTSSRWSQSCMKRGQYTAQAPIEIDLPANADTLACNKYLLFVFFFSFSIQKYI